MSKQENTGPRVTFEKADDCNVRQIRTALDDGRVRIVEWREYGSFVQVHNNDTTTAQKPETQHE